MTAPRCRRCNDQFEPTTANQDRCIRCEREVAALIDLDSRRRSRFARAVDLTGRISDRGLAA